MIQSFVQTFVKEEDGQDLVEYSLLLAFIALAAIALMGTVRTSLNTIWTNVNTKLGTAATQSGS
jgi:pilus assembly protein Flp/PilA